MKTDGTPQFGTSLSEPCPDSLGQEAGKTSEQAPNPAQSLNTVLAMRYGRGRLGGSGVILAAIQRARFHGRRIKPMEGDLKSRTLTSYYPSHAPDGRPILDGATMPRSENLGDFKTWIGDTMDDMAEDGISRALDISGGDRVMQELLADLSLAAFCGERGFKFLALCMLGRAVEIWESVRPAQPPMTDRKTGEEVNVLFACRGVPVANTYINKTLIPMLCRKAGVERGDVRGRITSHRARATIASQLYNAKEPMTLFELQAWLGHRSPETTQYYAQITPNTLTKAYTDAGYFARNVRTIEVLIDREAVLTGAAAAGEPWQHYDLGHGYCSYTFFEQCPHRMACARCDFYVPKPSSKAQLLEAKSDVDRRLAFIPLTDGERAAVEQDQQALDKLLDALANTPTPAGPTPREIAQRP